MLCFGRLGVHMGWTGSGSRVDADGEAGFCTGGFEWVGEAKVERS